MTAIGNVTTGKIDNNVVLEFTHDNNGSVLIVTCAQGEGRQTGDDPWATYGGVSMTLIGYSQVPTGGQGIYMFGLINPPRGENTVHIDISDPYDNTTMQATARSFIACAGWRTVATNQNASQSSISVDVSSVINDLVIDGVVNTYATSATPATATEGANQTEQSDHFQVSSNKEARESTSYEIATSTTTTMSRTLGANQYNAIIGIALIPASVGNQFIWFL